MKIVLLTGERPRHLYLAARLLELQLLGAMVVVQGDEPSIVPPPGLDPGLGELWDTHVRGQIESEVRFFGSPAPQLAQVPTLRIRKADLDSREVRAFARAQNAHLTVCHGGAIPSAETLAHFPSDAWRIQDGLSPWYRGANTLVWPSYMLEPQWTGMTVHQILDGADGDPILHQTPAPMVSGDGVHDLGCRAVAALVEELPDLLVGYRNGQLEEARHGTVAGKAWQPEDWRPDHLRLIYEVFGDRIVDAQLEGRLGRHRPHLIRQLEPEGVLVRVG